MNFSLNLVMMPKYSRSLKPPKKRAEVKNILNTLMNFCVCQKPTTGKAIIIIDKRNPLHSVDQIPLVVTIAGVDFKT